MMEEIESAQRAYEGLQIGEEIGNGGQKTVYKAKLGTQNFIFKILKFSSIYSSEEVRFTKEIEAIKACSSPYIVKLANIEPKFISDSSTRKIFACYGEEELMNIDVAGMKGNSKEVIKLGTHIMKALQIIHSIKIEETNAPIIHRDIKPENILYRESDDSYVLVDFGIALITNSPRITPTTAVIGTYGYRSPEQILSPHEVDFRSDIFSLGVTMYFLLTGKHPFFNNLTTVQEINMNTFFSSPTSPTDLDDSIPQELSNVIMEMMEKKSFRRINRHEEILERLDNISM